MTKIRPRLNKEKALYTFSFLFVLSVNLYFRFFPVYFPQLKAQAQEIAKQIVQQQAMVEVQKKFPQFYYSAKDVIVKSEMKQYYRLNKKDINKQTNNLYLNLKNKFQDDAGQTYLMELDCWHWARYVQNVLKFGHPGDEVIGGKQWDMLMLAPAGFFMNWEHFLYYASAFLYRVFCVFKTVPLFTFLFYLPLFFTAMFIIALYMFSLKYAGYLGAVITCLFMGLAPIFLPRSCAGWFDMDVLNLLFPILILWAYLLSIEKSSPREKIIWIMIAGFFVGLFAFTWVFWWFIFAVILIYEFLSLGWLGFCCFYPRLYFADFTRGARHSGDTRAPDGVVNLRKEILYLLRARAFYGLLFLGASFLGVLFICGGEPFVALFNHMKQTLILNKPLMTSIWPNVYSTVGELRRMNLKEIGQTAGAVWIVLLALFCMAVLACGAFLSKTFSESRRSAIAVFIIWLLAMVFATSRGVRFTVFLLVPLSIGLGWGLNYIYFYLGRKSKILSIVFTGVISFILCLALITKGDAVARSIYPLIDDTWYRVLTLVKEKTPEETIINSWWDFGDWFKVVARRRVIFDGQSQDTPQAYWMAKAMLSNNEEESLAILRMLNNVGNKPFKVINEYVKDELQTVLLLEYILTLPQGKAEEILKKFLPDAQALNVSKMLFSQPASAVFAVDYTMPLKMPAISYLGNWDFSKVYIAKNLNKLEKNEMLEYLKSVKSEAQAIETFYQEAFLITEDKLDEWLSDRLQFYSQLTGGTVKDGQVYFDNGFIYSLKDNLLKPNSGQILSSVFVFKDDKFTETVNPRPNLNFSALVYESKGAYKLILLDRKLAGSLFVRLYFLDGLGLKHFNPFIESEEGNNYIRFFVINW